MENKTKFYLIECYTGELLESGTDFQKIVEIPKSVVKIEISGSKLII